VEEFLSATVRGLAQGSLYTLLGLGFVIVYRATGVVNFAQPALMILGAYWTSYFALVVGLGFWPALAVAVLVTALIGRPSSGSRCGPWSASRCSRPPWSPSGCSSSSRSSPAT
jgi:branched-subunit amino acid ABC-type transport system permease component